MKLKIEQNKPLVNIFDGDNEFGFEFITAEKNYLIFEGDNNVKISLKKHSTAEIFFNDHSLNVKFEKVISYVQFISIKFSFHSIVEIHDKYIIFSAGDKDYVIDFNNTKYSFESDNILLIVLDNPVNEFSIKDLENFEKKFQAQNFQQLTLSNPFLIDDTCQMPEFSIGSYDDSSYNISRPVRQGNPVISTVPSLIDTNSSTDEIDYYNTGLGPISKTIYFKIICNTILESTLSTGDLSPNLQLKVYLPNGLDTVKAPVYVDMYFVSSDSTNNLSTYSASYTFYKQGRYNNIDYVDGFMYFDVHCPLTVQKSIPFQFDFQLL